MSKLRAISARDPEQWVYVEGAYEDGRAGALTSNLVVGGNPGERVLHLQLFDLHPRMISWYLATLWRADELAGALQDSVAAWRILASAALARSLLEGSLAFVAESHEIRKAWAKLKSGGKPGMFEARRFSEELRALLAQAQWGSQIGEKQPIRRPRVMSLLERGARVAGLDIESLKEQYNWLSDAIHPSFGYQTVYTPQILQHESGAQAIAHVRRRPLSSQLPDGYEPTVAIAAVDVACVAIEAIVRTAPSFLSVIDDYGLTTGVPFVSQLDYWRRFNRPARIDPCPCGSGSKFKACVHQWGMPAPEVGTTLTRH